MVANRVEREYGYKLFAKEFVSNGFNGTQAVKKVWPNISTDKSAGVKSVRLLGYDSVMSEIMSNLPDLNKCAANFERIRQLAEKKGDYSNALRAVEDHVRMQAGFKDSSQVDVRHGVMKQDEKEELANIRGKLMSELSDN